MKNFAMFVGAMILIFCLAFPACAATDSTTIAAPYLLVGFVMGDYEHSLSESTSINITGMYLTDGVIREIFKALFGVETDFIGVNGSYRIYPGEAQNGLYYGPDLMIALSQASNSSSSSNGTNFLFGGSLGVRKITDSGLTYDTGITVHYNPDQQNAVSIIRLNIGFGW